MVAGEAEVRLKAVKVVHLSSVHSATDVRIFCKECKSLAGAGYSVTLIAPHESDERVDGVQIIALTKPNGRLSRMTRDVYRLYRAAVREDADVYQFHDPELIPVGLLLRAKGKKVVYDIHEDVPRDIISKHYIPFWMRKPLGWLAERCENLASGSFSALVPATEAIAERFQRLNSRTVLVQNFPLLEDSSLRAVIPWRERTCSVAYVGGISRNRGLLEMVTAMSLLRDRLEVTLKLAGSFTPACIQEEASRLPGWEQVEVLGVVGVNRVRDTLRTVRAGLVLFHPDPNHVRAGPNKMFEYMSAGIPVIASNFPSWREIIHRHQCGLVVDPIQPRAIAEATEYLLTHPTEAEAMGRRGQEAVEKHYNWPSEERKLLALYDDLVEASCAE